MMNDEYDASFDAENATNPMLPPHSKLNEQSILGGLLINNRSFDQIADLIRAEDFYLHEHALIFKAIAHLIRAGQPVDHATVSDELNKNNELQNVGGEAYLIALASNTPSAANIRGYAKIVHDYSVLRQLSQVGTDIARMAYEKKSTPVEELLDEAESKVFHISETQRIGQDFQAMPEVANSVLGHIQMLYERKDKSSITGVATGFKVLDEKTAGLQAGDLIIVAGRPSMGKTAFAMNIAEHVGVRNKLPVAVFSMEMSAEQLVMRMISSLGNVNQGNLRTGRINNEDWDKIGNSIQQLSEAPIYIDETPALTALEVRARARRLASKIERPLGLIVLDYIQLMSGSGRSDNRVEIVGEISRALKSLARELKVPIIALSQLSRAVEQRPDKRPIMSDLRESGAIEQDADLIIFMYREAYYKPEIDDKNRAEAIISKHRNGPTGKVYLNFIGEYSKFGDSSYQFEQDNS